MSDFKEFFVNTDYFPEGMSADDFVKKVLALQEGKELSLEDIVDVEKFIQNFDEDEAKEKLKEFLAKNNINIQQPVMQQLLYASDKLDKKDKK